jgi:hypothetical protein
VFCIVDEICVVWQINQLPSMALFGPALWGLGSQKCTSRHPARGFGESAKRHLNLIFKTTFSGVDSFFPVFSQLQNNFSQREKPVAYLLHSNYTIFNMLMR